MPKLAATTPAPTSRPCVTATPGLAAGGTSSAYASAATTANTKLRPNTRAGCASPSLRVSPAARCQAGPNRTFEYHTPPSRNVETAATSTAMKFTSFIRSDLHGECIFTGVAHLAAELALDAQQLVVLGDAIAARHGSRLDLRSTGRDGDVGDGGIFGLTRTVRHDR